MSKTNNLTDFLTDTANAIRAKKGTTAKIDPQDFAGEIASIAVGTNHNAIYSSVTYSDDSDMWTYSVPCSINVRLWRAMGSISGSVDLEYKDTSGVAHHITTINMAEVDTWVSIFWQELGGRCVIMANGGTNFYTVITNVASLTVGAGTATSSTLITVYEYYRP
ncbi:MAG: hypothetical protein NC132_03150 [Corallococcus sp.]|nr:hypothetical protein [Corallococcus sp.]MCM1359104.1 hypothetical protein [Corallococcus sp.]MCM1395093.1 hypothetical protein [Corallococcus sp.]